MSIMIQLQHPVFSPLVQAFPYLPSCLAPWQGLTLGEVAAKGYGTSPRPGRMTASSEVIDCMTAQATRVLGPETGAALRRHLHENNAVLSANLHAIDCLPEMTQAIHAFALDRMAYGEAGTVIPVLSCGGVSLQSQAYPRGLQSFRSTTPKRFPLFSGAWRQCVELNTPALSAQKLQSSLARWEHPLPHEQRAINAVLDCLLEPETLAQERFGDQVTRVNARLCAQRFPDTRPVVIYLELEEIARQLLLRDLHRPESLLYRALFRSELRTALAHSLVGVRGCWTRQVVDGETLSPSGSYGSLFFWGIDSKGMRCPMHLANGQTRPELVCSAFRLPFTPDAVTEGLLNRTLYPGLFVSYMTLAYEHGLRCYGGLFLTQYLATMVQRVRELFTACGESLPPDPAATALTAFAITVQTRTEQGNVPAGALELSAAGGLSRADLQRLAMTPLEDILPLSLATWGLEYLPNSLRSPDVERGLREAAQHWRGLFVTPKAH